MSSASYIARRVLLLVPQLALISVATFVLIRLLPGDPARLELGPLASQQAVDELRDSLKLDDPLPAQYTAYLDRLMHADLGRSWVNQSSVATDLGTRIPATLELMAYGLIVVLVVLLPLAIITAMPGGGPLNRIAKRVTFGYGLLAGALPDFLLGLLLIFVFYTKLHILPGPTGRLDVTAMPPPTVTGAYTVDAVLAGQWSTFRSAAVHLILPVATLAFVYGGPVFKMARSSMSDALRSNYTLYAEGLGVPRSRVLWFAFRNAAPPTVVIIGVVAGYLLGGAVLIETVFNLNGVGQYAVQSITASDYAPLQAFVLLAAVFTMLVYLTVDLVHFAIDPRIRLRAGRR